jgi:hypothetical protein
MKKEVLDTLDRSNRQGYCYSFNDLGILYSYLIDRRAGVFITANGQPFPHQLSITINKMQTGIV